MTDQTAYSLLRHFTAEAHRRKWDYDRGLDGDGVPLKSEAFDALHRLGDEMNAALQKLDAERQATPVAAGVVPASRCDVGFVFGGRCVKPAGHRPPGSDDPHVCAPAAAGVAPAANQTVSDRVRAVCERLRRASVLADGQPHTDRERGIVHAVDRVLGALDAEPRQPAADQTGLRDRIAEAIHRDRFPDSDWAGQPEAIRNDYRDCADAVMAVLPDQQAAIRAAALQEGADAIDRETQQAKDDGVLEPDKFRPCRDASEQLRRMAAGAQQQGDTETRCTCADAGDCFAPAGHYADCPQAAAQQQPAVAGEEQA